MSDDTLKTFDNLSSISNQDIDDALDIIPISHGVGTISQGDKKVKIGQLQQMTVLRCRTDGNVANKQAEYVGGLPLNGNSQACIGRTVLVIFDNKNTAAEPTFSFKNLTGPIILLNQASNVTLGSGCVLANSRNIMTWDGQNWCLHSDIAEITSEYTKYADGTIIYLKNYQYKDITITTNQGSYRGEYGYYGVVQLADENIFNPVSCEIIQSTANDEFAIAKLGNVGNTLFVVSTLNTTYKVRIFYF